jgi:DNA polymerase alpha subunit A
VFSVSVKRAAADSILRQPQDAEIYDSVTEDQYKQIVGDRLAKDDFIEDDDGGGYQDNGMDDWDEEKYSDSEEENTKRKGESPNFLLIIHH